MVSKEGGPGDLDGKRRLGFAGGIWSKWAKSWLSKNWQATLVLVFIIFLAFFVRTYFVYSPAVDNGYLVSGGSDSYYHQRVIDHVVATGQHLFNDPTMNYPIGIRNERPPLYDWSVAVFGMLSSAVTGISTTSTVGFTLDASTAFWGALTVIPVYLIGRQAFGRKAGLAAAFLFSIMPGDIERSVFSNADHDSMVLFFAVTSFYFLLMALASIKGDKWVSKWSDRKSILPGLAKYFGQNQLSTIYAALAGVCIATIAMIWTGYTYLLIIILAYFLVQLFINRFKNIDSLGATVVVFVLLAIAFIVTAPAYWQLQYWYSWFDVPVLLFIGAMLVGVIFVVTRDYPWTLVIPSFIIFAVVALAGVAVVAPNIFDAIVTGQGYLVKSKLYSTISEAQAPAFSTLALSFGAVTFWLAFVGVVWAAIQIPKKLSAYFVFIVVWTAVSMYMAISAGRFLFNAAPAFAVMSGWILVLIIEWLHFEEVSKGLSNIRGNLLGGLRKAFKVRHIAGVLFLGFLVILPNAWTAVDAGIPTELKRGYDLQVYNAVPDFLKPDGYDAVNGSYWYFGAFSYSLPMPTNYYPAAWSWFSQQDTRISPIQDRPAYVSWWDYGFEAVQAGGHPTVADNFQNGYQIAGTILMCQSENEAIALFVARILDETGIPAGSPIELALSGAGVDVAKMKDVITHPSNYISVVLNNQDIYGPFDSSLSAPNAKYAVERVELTKVGSDNLVALYHNLREITGIDIGYFAVDSRLFPFSATSNNIFYAPAKLSDRRIDPLSNAPIDYFTIQAIDTEGNAIDLQNVTSSTQITGYQIVYTDMFYKSMVYRAMMGYGPSDVGATTQGIPGISGSLASLPPMPGWNLTHFIEVYRTAYFNPFPQADVANHSSAWRAISYDEGLFLQTEIGAGRVTGTVDLSAAGLESGVVFLEYYDGAIINGTVTSSSGVPYAGIFVTVDDQYGIPHQMVQTDANGRYSVIAPFGNVTVIFSNGNLDARTLQGANMLGATGYTISKAQADRQGDYQLNGDKVIEGNTVKGQVFWDVNSDGTFTSGTDEMIVGATVVIENQTTGFQITTTSTSTGYSFTGVPPIDGIIYPVIEGHVTDAYSINTVSAVTKDLPIGPASISGIVTLASGDVGSGVALQLIDFTNGDTIDQTTLANGSYSFTMLLPGQYQILSAVNDTTFGILPFGVTQGEAMVKDLTLYQALKVSGTTLIQGIPTGYVAVALTSSDLTQHSVSDLNGTFNFVVPAGNYSLSAFASANGIDYVALVNIAGATGSVTVDPSLQPGNSVVFKVTGTTLASGTEVRIQSRTTGAVVAATTNATGMFRAVLPTDNYFVYAATEERAFWGDVFVFSNADQVINLVTAASISGQVWYDSNFNGVRDSGEGLADVPLIVEDSNARSIEVRTASDGSFAIPLVPDLSYTLTLSKNGYGTQTFVFDPLSGSVSKLIQLIPLNRSVSATITYLGTPLAGIEVHFNAAGQGAASALAVTDLDGRVSLTLQPGKYNVVVDQNVTEGSNATRYQFGSTLVVSIGKDLEPLSIAAAKRYLVTVVLSGSFGALPTPTTSITLAGPETVMLTERANATTYLVAGDYDVYASAVSGGSRYATLSLQTVGEGANTMTVALEQAFTVRGTLQFDGRGFSNIVPVNITKSTGGTLSVSSTASGVFNANLPAGSYTAAADLRTEAPISGSEKYLRYQGASSFDLSANLAITVSLTRDFDNATVTGSVLFNGVPVSANLEFIPASVTAMAANVTAVPSGFDAAVAPGNYSVYVKQTNGIGVFLGTVQIEPRVANFLNFTLVNGLRYSGTTMVNGVGVSATLAFSNADYVAITSDVGGVFEVFLPAGDYSVTAAAIGAERGISVDYKTTFFLNLAAPTGQTINLEKVVKHSIELTWNQAEKMTVSPGGVATYNVYVINHGNVADTVTLSAVTAPSGWTVSFSQSTVAVDFGATDNSQRITVTITTPATALVSHSSISVRGTSTSAATASNTVSLDVIIVPQYSVSLGLDSAQATTGANFTYDMKVSNTGNIDDSYTVTVSNLADLASLGWRVELKGSSGDFGNEASISVGAGKSADVHLRLTKIRDNPDPLVTVTLVAVSKAQPSATTVLAFVPDLPEFTVPGGGLSVRGGQVSTAPPVFPALTIGLIGLALVVFTVLILMSVQRGVFRRGKKR